MFDFSQLLGSLSDYVKNRFDRPPQQVLYPMQMPNPKNYAEATADYVPAKGIPQGGFNAGDNLPEEKPKYKLDYSDRPSFPQQYVNPVLDSSETYGVDPNVLFSLLAQETGGAGYDPLSRGTSGEVGLAQIIPNFHYKNAGFQSEDEYARSLEDPNFAIEQAAYILNDMLDLYDQNYYDALAAYNAGPGGYNQSGYGKDYAEEVLRRAGMLDQYLQQ